MLDVEKLMNPETIKANLVLCSLYLTAYKVLKSAIVDNIRDFFTFNCDMDGKPIADK